MCGIHPRLLARVIEHVRENLDGALSVGELADLVGMSESHFSKLFKRDTGLTPHQFILNERINCSKELLQRGISRLVDVALDVGFQKPGALHNRFSQCSRHHPWSIPAP